MPMSPGVLSYACDPSTLEIQAAGLQIQGQSELQIETVSIKQSKTKVNATPRVNQRGSILDENGLRGQDNQINYMIKDACEKVGNYAYWL